MRCAAKAAYFRCQGDQRIRRALLQRSRVAPGTLEVRDVIYFYRKPKDSKNWIWRGPATVIGHEGPNTWASFGGRCHLVAPEKLGEAFSLKTTKDGRSRRSTPLRRRARAHDDRGGRERLNSRSPPSSSPPTRRTRARWTMDVDHDGGFKEAGPRDEKPEMMLKTPDGSAYEGRPRPEPQTTPSTC